MKKLKIFTLVFALMLIVSSSPVYAAPDPKLTDVLTYAVVSEDSGSWEYLDRNQILTDVDHGGEFLYIVTLEVGYSNPSSRIAKINGHKLKEIKQFDYDPDHDSIVDGWFRMWDASDYSDGNFTYRASSINFPYNKMSTFINIK